MNTTKSDEHCPCGSGLAFTKCCGVEGRTALNTDMVAALDRNGNPVVGSLTEELTTAINQIAVSPDMFFARFQFIEERAYAIKMTPQYYQDTVFLEPGRIKGTCFIEAHFKWIESVAESIPLQKMPIIFHTAFCGSTLMSQALHAAYNVLSLREPECLNNLLTLFRSQLRSEYFNDDWLEIVLKLLSRRYQPETTTVVKTNDFSNPMMIEILNRHEGIPCLFMYTPLNEFVAGCLKAENRRQWISGRYKSTLQYTDELFAEEFDPESIDDQAFAEMAAFYWSYNIALFFQSWRAHPERIRSLDFNAMLSDPMQAITTCGEWFGLEKSTDPESAEKIDALFGVYSKNSSMSYSPQQRQDDIQKQLADYADELEKAQQLATQLLGDDYPKDGLPAALLEAKS